MAQENMDKLAPFFWVEHENRVSVCLRLGVYLQEVFDARTAAS